MSGRLGGWEGGAGVGLGAAAGCHECPPNSLLTPPRLHPTSRDISAHSQEPVLCELQVLCAKNAHVYLLGDDLDKGRR